MSEEKTDDIKIMTDFLEKVKSMNWDELPNEIKTFIWDKGQRVITNNMAYECTCYKDNDKWYVGTAMQQYGVKHEWNGKDIWEEYNGTYECCNECNQRCIKKDGCHVWSGDLDYTRN